MSNSLHHINHQLCERQVRNAEALDILLRVHERGAANDNSRRTSMRSIIRQALGREPESLWMTIAGTAALFLIPIVFALVAVAFGWGKQ
jgi:hypothetical protein